MTNPDWNLQVKIGNGRRDTGAHHRAINVAQQLLAVGKWPNYMNTLIIIHDAYDLHRRLQMSEPGAHNADYNVVVYPAVYELAADQDYEIVPMSDSFRKLHDL
ncbi:MAG: hypothetical protein HF973_09225 [Chloroflexi bacterium]|nr:hypothetical protein [Chloroflexota bacterium]